MARPSRVHPGPPARLPTAAGGAFSEPLSCGSVPAANPLEMSVDPTPRADSDIPRTVLVVDDDHDLRRTLVRALKAGGYVVVDADSAERGLQLAESWKTPIDVALLDIILPDSWGAQLVPGLRMNHPDIRIIYTSGYAESDPVLKAGIDAAKMAFLPKPFEPSDLLEMVEQVLAEGESEEAGS